MQTTIGGRHHTPAWHRARAITAVCSNLAIIMERTDEQILPAVYNFIGRTFDATPSQLGALTLSRAFAQAITSPLGGVLGERREHPLTIIRQLRWCANGVPLINLGTSQDARWSKIACIRPPELILGLWAGTATCLACVRAGHYLNRMWVVSFGCILWGVMTAAFSAAPSLNFWSMLVWSITGLGLALVIPNVQSVIAGARHFCTVLSRYI